VADTERLLAGRELQPEAPAEQRALAGLLGLAAGPPSDQELAAEAAAVAAFRLAVGERTARSARPRALAGRGRAVTVGIAAAVLVGFSGAAAADVLPASVQELAHTAFGAPKPRHPAPASPSGSPTPVVSSGGPTATASPSPTHGKAKGKATPPGHQGAKAAATG